MEVLGTAAPDIVGIVFLAGVVSMFVGISTPEYSGLDREIWGMPTKQYLQAIHANRRPWRWASAWIVAATVLNVLGFGLLSVLLRDVGGHLLGEAAQLVFLVGALLWIVVMAFRMGVEPIAAEALARAETVPDWFEPVQAWAMRLSLIYMVLGYVATAIVGWGLLQTAMLPAWLGWLSLGLGIGGALSLIFTIPRYADFEFSVAFIPLWLHVIPLILGITLLVQP